ncbi:MAG: hypothetical protein J0651_05580, partial [Actinobacteria bacterium]|nr:hypothetical protein [Actinomycetota bacterium]
MNSGYFLKVVSTKWSANEPNIDVPAALAQTNINISHCVFRNNSFTSGVCMALTYQAGLQNIVLQSLNFTREVGRLISISSAVPTVKRIKGIAYFDERTQVKVVTPPAVVTLQHISILNCPTANLIHLSRL